MLRKTVVLGLSPVDPTLLMPVANALVAQYGGETILDYVDADLETAFSVERGQYDAEGILAILADRDLGQTTIVVAFTEVDLFVPHMSFLIGYAEPSLGIALVSLARLRSGANGSDGDILFASRLAKEAVHEVGHLLGLVHCPDRRCAMRFSSSLTDLDGRSTSLCQQCRVSCSQAP